MCLASCGRPGSNSSIVNFCLFFSTSVVHGKCCRCVQMLLDVIRTLCIMSCIMYVLCVCLYVCTY